MTLNFSLKNHFMGSGEYVASSSTSFSHGLYQLSSLMSSSRGTLNLTVSLASLYQVASCNSDVFSVFFSAVGFGSP